MDGRSHARQPTARPRRRTAGAGGDHAATWIFRVHADQRNWMGCERAGWWSHPNGRGALMGNWYQSWTNCCTNVNSWFSDNSVNWYTALIGVVGVLVGVGVGGVTAALIPGAATALAILCLAGVYYCNWWLNIRLICLGGDRSAIGAIFNIEPPTPSLDFLNLGDYDTDYSFNLLIYPALPLDMLPNWFVDNFSPPTSPTPWQLSPITQLQPQWPRYFRSSPGMMPTSFCRNRARWEASGLASPGNTPRLQEARPPCLSSRLSLHRLTSQ